MNKYLRRYMEQEGLKFYRCSTCGNLLMVLIDPNVAPTCCGHEMSIVECQSSGEGSEKHLPIIEKGNTHTMVRVGRQLHAMSPEHRVEWVALTDGQRVEMQKLSLTTEPIAQFSLMDETGGKLRAYSFCNIHGLWGSEK